MKIATDNGKVFNDHEPLNRESTTTECLVNYQICSNATEVTQWGAPSCSGPQPATDNGVRDGRSNWLAVTPHHTQGNTPYPRIARCTCGLQIARLGEATGVRSPVLGYARPTHCLCCHSGYNCVISYIMPSSSNTSSCSSRTDHCVHFQQNAGLRLFMNPWIMHGIDDCYQLTRIWGTLCQVFVQLVLERVHRFTSYHFIL